MMENLDEEIEEAKVSEAGQLLLLERVEKELKQGENSSILEESKSEPVSDVNYSELNQIKSAGQPSYVFGSE